MAKLPKQVKRSNKAVKIRSDVKHLMSNLATWKDYTDYLSTAKITYQKYVSGFSFND